MRKCQRRSARAVFLGIHPMRCAGSIPCAAGCETARRRIESRGLARPKGWDDQFPHPFIPSGHSGWTASASPMQGAARGEKGRLRCLALFPAGEISREEKRTGNAASIEPESQRSSAHRELAPRHHRGLAQQRNPTYSSASALFTGPFRRAEHREAWSGRLAAPPLIALPAPRAL